ncbi:MAG: hypothetical protein AB1755_06355 [Candidatus Omnitrophota bacterium]
MKQISSYVLIIGFLLIVSGCAREDVKTGDTMFKESSAKFDAEDTTFKIPFDIPQAEKVDAVKAERSKLK